MAKRTTKTTIGSTLKQIKPTTPGKCPYCHKKIKAIEAHIHDMHKGEKPAKKR